ncbi:cytochrome c3 family protein [Tautonia rosea]|uniref:cytochrome c3 family protein n=1 Tax=Tautonia rosea TaxID=2728037 RepID=UPI00160174CE|nr:cytochrome c3 family protein [Tautonia rosea]
MPQIFHPSANTLARASIFGGAFVALGAVLVTHMVIRSPYQTEVHVVKSQPVPFSHEHHVRGLGIDCRYCHTSVEESSFAGLPPTYTCMSCHSQIWTDSPMLAPVRESLALDRPLEWNRIHDVPDYTYFNHAIHVNKGVGCYSCHGRVDLMPLAWKEESMSMGWCLECHRNPEKHLRPREEIYNLEWSVDKDQEAVKAFVTREADAESKEFLMEDDYVSQEELGQLLAAMYEVPTLGHNTPLTNCAVCHR